MRIIYTDDNLEKDMISPRLLNDSALTKDNFDIIYHLYNKVNAKEKILSSVKDVNAKLSYFASTAANLSNNIQSMRSEVLNLEGIIDKFNKNTNIYRNDAVLPVGKYNSNYDVQQIKYALDQIVKQISAIVQNLNIPNQSTINRTINRSMENIVKMTNREEKDIVVNNAIAELSCMDVPDILVNYPEYISFNETIYNYNKVKTDALANKAAWLDAINNTDASDTEKNIVNNIDNEIKKYDSSFNRYKYAVNNNYVPDLKNSWKNVYANLKITLSNYAESVTADRIKTKINTKYQNRMGETNELYKTITSMNDSEMSGYAATILSSGIYT